MKRDNGSSSMRIRITAGLGCRSYRRLFLSMVALLMGLFIYWPATQVLAAGSSSFDPAVDYGSGDYPRSVTTGDFNGDDKTDLVVANYLSSNNISIMLGNGDASFGTAVNYTVGVYPISVTTGDFNADGKTDLVAVNSFGSISILLGVGDGTFGTAVNYTVGVYPISVTTGDFNADGKTDLAVTNYEGYSYPCYVAILLGMGDGTFGAATNYDVGSIPKSVTTGDFNGDNKTDLAVANWNSNDVSILLGNGNGTFNAAVNYGVWCSPLSVITGDFNADGKTDFAVAENDTGSVSILLGNGDGTFANAVDYYVGSNPHSVVTGDFNGDGKIDLATANMSSSNVSILMGNGDGTFDAAVNYAVRNSPESLTTGDFNGDGRTDLAVTNFRSSNVSILINTTCMGNKPDLSLSKDNVHWASYADYTARLLTVNMTIHNSGFETAYNVSATGALNTGGVITKSIGTVGGFVVSGRTSTCLDCPGGSAAINMIVEVPVGVTGFRQTVNATAEDVCGNTYVYPGPYPGA